MDEQLQKLIERLAMNEAAIKEQTRVFKECIEQNTKDHLKIMEAVAVGEKWRNRVQWSATVFLLTIGGIIGFFMSHIEWFWNILPMHRHTHGG